MPRYQWLLFDADGTLFDFERAESAALEQAFRHLGFAFDPEYLSHYRHINHALWLDVEKGTVKPAQVKVRRFELLVEKLKLDHAPESLGERYLECLAECSELIAGAAEVIEALQVKHRLAILTNGLQVVQRGRLARSPIRHHIADIIISEEIGHSKPAKEFFATALARIGNPPPGEVLMIGDSWNADIIGAVEFGLDACWYNPARKSRPTADTIIREIATLHELVTWLD